MAIFTIDGKEFNVTVPSGGIQRSFSVLDTDKSGRSQSGDMIRDIIGTYYNYSIAINTKLLKNKEYDDLYEIISSPAEYHMLTVPYGQTTLTFKAYVTSGTDSFDTVDKNGTKRWKGLKLNFVAMSPQRRA